MDSCLTNPVWLCMMALVSARCAGVFVVGPGLANPAVPIPLRLGLSLVIGLAAMGRLVGPTPALPANGLEFAVALVIEAAIGAAIGYLARLVFVGVELAAMHIGQQMGVTLAEVFDPLMEERTESVSRLLQLTALVVFLSIGGHRAMIAAMLGTFDMLPPGFAELGQAGRMPSCQAMLKAAAAMLAMSFVLALKIAAPVLAAILIATVAAGLVQKTLPQLNILTVGLPMRAMLGLAVLAASLAMLGPLLESAVGFLTRQWTTAIQVVQ